MAPVNHTRPAILAALEIADMGRDDLAREIGATGKTVQYNLRRLLADGLIHIVDWVEPKMQGLRSPVYRLGPGKNVPKARQTKREKAAVQAEWYKRHRRHRQLKQAAGNPFSVLLVQAQALGDRR